MQPSAYYVYVLFRPWDGTPCYVGKGSGRRWLVHDRPSATNKHLQNIWGKAVALGMEIPKVKIRENLTEDEAFVVERAFILAIGRHDLGFGPLANRTNGGEGTANPSADTILKRSLKMKGRPCSQEAKDKIRAKLLGHKVSPETRAKIGAKSKLAWAANYARLSKASKDRNYSPSPEVRAKVSAFHKGRRRPEEFRRKMMIAMKGNQNGRRKPTADKKHQR